MEKFEWINIVITILIIMHYYIFPKKDCIDLQDIPKEYIIDTSNRIDIQSHSECAAFASAYVLRHLGVEAEGKQIYRGFPCKLFDGRIMCKGIVKYFRKHHYNATFYKGNVGTLKKQISRGVPVIVFIRTSLKGRYLHFVPVVGYDEEYFYIAESLQCMINSDEKSYNRKVKIDDFEKLWHTWVPFYKNTYISIMP